MIPHGLLTSVTIRHNLKRLFEQLVLPNVRLRSAL
jgi:hypothetical protein